LNYQYKTIENYLKLCSDESENLKSIKIEPSINPKISIISPVYNTGKFVLRLLKSIYYQSFNSFEIILIDDCSEDNSVELIKKYKKYDKRIHLIQNKINKGTFASRNLGTLKSKGDFVMLPDPDDILLENSLKYFYYFSIKYNYEVVRYNVYLRKGITFFGHITEKLKSKPIYQPELSTYIFYGLGFLMQVDYNIWNKFIKRETLIKCLNRIGEKNTRMFMTGFEDGLLNYIIYREAKSFYFLKKFCYYYIKNNIKKKQKYSYLLYLNHIKFIFIYLIYVFKYSKNTKHEKDMANDIFRRLIYNNKIKNILYLNKTDYNFFSDIINTINGNEFFNINYKKYLAIIKSNFKIV